LIAISRENVNIWVAGKPPKQRNPTSFKGNNNYMRDNNVLFVFTQDFTVWVFSVTIDKTVTMV
jgi:hypothetical protein